MKYLSVLLALLSLPISGQAGFLDRLTGKNEEAPPGSFYSGSVERFVSNKAPRIAAECKVFPGDIKNAMASVIRLHLKEGRVESPTPGRSYYFPNMGITSYQEQVFKKDAPFLYFSFFTKEKSLCEALVKAHAVPEDEATR